MTSLHVICGLASPSNQKSRLGLCWGDLKKKEKNFLYGKPQFSASFVRHVARNLQWGGLFWRLEITSYELDSDFDRSELRLSQFFCPNLGDLQKKKVFTKIESIFLSHFR